MTCFEDSLNFPDSQTSDLFASAFAFSAASSASFFALSFATEAEERPKIS
jgi:hypothetical protein